jgi:arginine/lysine/ornithine decarboxylase
MHVTVPPFFFTTRSTAGVLAALLAAVRRHQHQQHHQRQQQDAPRTPKVLLPRNVHKSAINGLILAGAEPVFLTPVYDAAMDICHGVPLEEGGEGSLAGALQAHAPSGDVAAVLLVSPTYHGAALDVARAVTLCREHGVLLIVDEAHGAHLSFLLRGQELLGGALAAGADLVVQSTHKTLAAFSQSAMMHAGESEEEEEEHTHTHVCVASLVDSKCHTRPLTHYLPTYLPTYTHGSQARG